MLLKGFGIFCSNKNFVGVVLLLNEMSRGLLITVIIPVVSTSPKIIRPLPVSVGTNAQEVPVSFECYTFSY